MRWLLPVIAAISLLGSSVTAWAAAGWVGDSTCCCPVKAKCKCHDHDDDHDSGPVMKRCSGQAKLIAPIVATAVLATPPTIVETSACAAVATEHCEPVPDDVTYEPETPPF